MDILDKVAKKYGTGDWVVDKGHVQEAKIIKELVEALKKARSNQEWSENRRVETTQEFLACKRELKTTKERNQNLEKDLEGWKKIKEIIYNS